MQVPGISRKIGLKCKSNKAFLQFINYLPFILNFALFGPRCTLKNHQIFSKKMKKHLAQIDFVFKNPFLHGNMGITNYNSTWDSILFFLL